LASGCGGRTRSAVLQRLDPLLRAPVELTPDELAALVAFVRDGLLDPDDRPERLRKLIPDRLPSGRKGFDCQV
jgi:cytochrome c peroxidase